MNVDDTGNQNDDPNACLPVSTWLPDGTAGSTDPQLSQCGWTSIRQIPGSAPIATQGTQDDLGATTPLDLPPGRYLISVAANGYKLDGAHFTVPESGPTRVQVQMAPYDLPLATLRVQVFDDNASVNGQWDEPVETGNGMIGFQAHLADVLGEVTTDWYGNPLCTLYQQGRWDSATDSWVNVTRADPYKGPYVLDADGAPVVKTVGGRCLSEPPARSRSATSARTATR